MLSRDIFRCPEDNHWDKVKSKETINDHEKPSNEALKFALTTYHFHISSTNQGLTNCFLLFLDQEYDVSRHWERQHQPIATRGNSNDCHYGGFLDLAILRSSEECGRVGGFETFTFSANPAFSKRGAHFLSLFTTLSF